MPPRSLGPRRRCSFITSGSTGPRRACFSNWRGILLYAAPALRPSSETILRGAGSQPGLWSLGISGDLPIILLRISNVEDIRVARQMLQAMEYWRNQRLEVDLVIVNERAPSYVQDLQTELENLVRTNQARPPILKDVGGGQIFILRADIVATHAIALLQSVARVVLRAERGGLAEQLKHIAAADGPPRVVREPRVICSAAACRCANSATRILQRPWRFRQRW